MTKCAFTGLNFQECYLQEEVLCRNSNMSEDPQSIKSFLDQALYYLKDRTSIIALDECELSDRKGAKSLKGEGLRPE